jgi:hypothetical protein
LSGAGLDCAEGFIPDDRGIDNHEWSVRVDEAFEQKVGNGLVDDRFALRTIEGEASGAHAVV